MNPETDLPRLHPEAVTRPLSVAVAEAAQLLVAREYVAPTETPADTTSATTLPEVRWVPEQGRYVDREGQPLTHGAVKRLEASGRVTVIR